MVFPEKRHIVLEPTVWREFAGRDHDDAVLSLVGAVHLTGRGDIVCHAMRPGSLLCAAWLRTKKDMRRAPVTPLQDWVRGSLVLGGGCDVSPTI